MRLTDLVQGLGISGGNADLEISGIQYDSRRVEPGDLFVVWTGQRSDGRVHAAQAIANGAVAVLAAGPPLEASSGSTPWLVAADPRALLGPLGARLYGHPDRELVLAGVTGTNGKGTTATVLARVLEAAGRPCGFLGSYGYSFAGQAYRGDRTTPEGSDLFRLLREMRRAGAQGVAMEVSSHALVQGRLDGAAFDVAVFLNLTRDHFDFHTDFEDYFAAKRRLFDKLKPGGRAVANADDPYGARLLAEIPGALGFGESAAVRAREVVLDTGGVRGVMVTPRGEFPFDSPLRGRFNYLNLLAATAAGEALGLPHEAIARGLAAQGPLPGRMEPIERGQEFPVFVDYAHTDAALAAALASFREFTRRKVVVVFGCGGDRDPGKRPLMGQVAGQLAELPIATSDNPRSEDPMAILSAVEEGLKRAGNAEYRIVPDRREAIRRAVTVASMQPGDWAVLVAGKGHEDEQILADRRIHFSDREETATALEERLGSSAGG